MQQPPLPFFTSWGQVGLVALGAGLVIRYVIPFIRRNGAANGSAEWRGRVEQILVSNSAALNELVKSHIDMKVLLTEIERRGRDSERAIRKTLGEPV